VRRSRICMAQLVPIALVIVVDGEEHLVRLTEEAAPGETRRSIDAMRDEIEREKRRCGL